MDIKTQEHWNLIFSSKETHQLGWYESVPTPSLRLIAKCKLSFDEPILDVGAGSSTLIDCLLEKGYHAISAIDISKAALDTTRQRLGEERSALVKWVVDDLTQPTMIQELNDIALWHDRAVLHFLTQENDKRTYLATLQNVLRIGGYVIVAAFALNGSKRCSGLPVRNYDQHSIKQFFGKDFKLLEYFDHTHIMPSGEPRPFVYTLLSKLR